MDGRNEITNRIVNALAIQGINISQNMLDDLSSILCDYKITPYNSRDAPDFPARIKHFLTAKKIDGLSPRTLKSYEQRLSLFSRYTDKAVSDITTDDIRRYLSYLSEERKLKETTLASDINVLRSFFSWLFVEEIIKKNPMLKIKSLRLNKKHLRESLTIEEIEKIRKSYHRIRDKAIFELFYSTGCRLSEVINMNVADLDFQERSVKVIGKGNKQRKVYFSIRAKLYISEYLITRKGADKAALFVGEVKPHERLKAKIIQDVIKRMGVEAQLEVNIFPHVLRHSFATHALGRGMELGVIQALLGHESPNTTQIYAVISDNAVRNEYSKLIL